MRNILNVPPEITQFFAKKNVFSALMQLKGKAFRDVPGRKTMQVALGEKSYFIKQHFGVGWGEIFKNLTAFKKPILGAMTEVHAIQKVVEIGIATTPLVAYGQQGCNPAHLQSFVLTDDLGDIISLETLCADWQNNPPAAHFKQQIIIAMATLSAKLHGAGCCHRDFYLCHFVLKKAVFTKVNANNGSVELMLIDLHRMLESQSVHGHAVMKDIAALMFSAMDSGFDANDWHLFKQHYLPQSAAFWQKAQQRAAKLHKKFHSKKFQTRLGEEKAKIK